jgi:cysteinyl-tRNA synthetase
MPAIAAVQLRDGVEAKRYGSWPFFDDMGEVPSDDVLIPLARVLLHLRLHKDFHAADGIRQYVQSYGIQVECEKDRVRFKW